jgi:Tfp pilus assembly protein PilO
MAEIILFGTTVFSLFAFYIAANEVKKLLTRNKELRIELEKQKRNSAYLATHAAEMARIERSSNALKKEIQGAKSDEEIADIINAVIDSNNKRVQNNAD